MWNKNCAVCDCDFVAAIQIEAVILIVIVHIQHVFVAFVIIVCSFCCCGVCDEKKSQQNTIKIGMMGDDWTIKVQPIFNEIGFNPSWDANQFSNEKILIAW